MKQKVFITRHIADESIQRLKQRYEVRVYPKDHPIPRTELLRGVKWADALLSLLTDKIDKKVIDANPKLKIIANYTVGYDNVDIKYATQKSIPVTNTAGSSDDAVAEHALTLMLALARNLIVVDTFTRQKKYHGWKPYTFLGEQLKGKVLGIIGLGRIGSSLAARVHAGLGMKVIYHDVVRNAPFEQANMAKFVPVNTLLKTADFVSLHVPLLPSTRHLISTKQLRMMKKTAYLINTSRGPVVDEKALVRALQKKVIAGAGLDVYEFEPNLAPGLEKLKNVILTPHTASATIEARKNMANIAANCIIKVLEGKRPKYVVNPEVYKH